MGRRAVARRGLAEGDFIPPLSEGNRCRGTFHQPTPRAASVRPSVDRATPPPRFSTPATPPSLISAFPPSLPPLPRSIEDGLYHRAEGVSPILEARIHVWRTAPSFIQAACVVHDSRVHVHARARARARVAIALTSRKIKLQQPALFSRAISTSRSFSQAAKKRGGDSRRGEPDSHLSR